MQLMWALLRLNFFIDNMCLSDLQYENYQVHVVVLISRRFSWLCLVLTLSYFTVGLLLKSSLLYVFILIFIPSLLYIQKPETNIKSINTRDGNCRCKKR